VPTTNQLFRKGRSKIKVKTKAPGPVIAQEARVCMRVYTSTRRSPLGLEKVARVRLTNGLEITTYNTREGQPGREHSWFWSGRQDQGPARACAPHHQGNAGFGGGAGQEEEPFPKYGTKRAKA